MSTLMKASTEWSSRPADERFPSIEALHAYCLSERQLAGGATIKQGEMRAKAADDGSLVLNGKTSQARLTNWSFGQLATRAEAPAGYLRTLPAEIAAQCLNLGLDRAPAENARLLIKRATLLDQEGKPTDLPTIRAITSERYDRIWNADITSRLLDLKHGSTGWQEAPEAFDGSRGQYAGDRDMFSFFVDNDRRIFETKQGGLSRGFFVWNSEVGSSVFGIMTFLYEYCCGNHRVWGASNVTELRIRHVGDAAARAFGQLRGRLIQYANSSASEDTLKIQRARDYNLGTDKASVLDTVLGMKSLALSGKTADKAYQLAVEHEDWYGSPNSAWGFVGGLTQVARDMPNANERVTMERVGAKIMELAF